MAGKGEPLPGGPPVPSTYPNPLANNVNMNPIDVAYKGGVTTKPSDPIHINGAHGSAASHA